MSVVSRAVATANRVGGKLKLKSRVTLKSFTGDSGKGDDAYTSKVHLAFVDRKQQSVTAFDGTEKKSSTVVTFADPAIRVNEFDIIILDDGSGGPVLAVGGFVDGETSRPALTEVFL